MSEIATDGRRYLFTLSAAGGVVEVRPCADDVVRLVRPEGRGVAMLGDAPTASAIASAVNVAAIQSSLSGALSPSQLANVVQTYTGLSAIQAQSAVSLAASVISGSPPTWQTVAPLVAGAVSLIPGVGPVTVAVVAAAVEFLPEVLSALGIGGGSAHCDWNVGGVCFTGIVPYGPKDPGWITWAKFVSGSTSGPMGALSSAYPDYLGTIGCELPVLDARIAEFAGNKIRATQGGVHLAPGFGLGPGGALAGAGGVTPAPPPAPTPAPTTSMDTMNVWLFLRAFYALWQGNAEQAINGHPYAKDADLLAQFAAAWNASHDGTYQYTFQPATRSMSDVVGSYLSGHCAVQLETDITDPSVPTFVSLLLAGQVDGHDEPPLTIHVGQALDTSLPPPGASSAPSSSSAGTAVAVVGGLGILTLIGYLAKVPVALFGGRR